MVIYITYIIQLSCFYVVLKQQFLTFFSNYVVVVYPLQPSLSVSPGSESSVHVSSLLACPTNSQVSNQCGEQCSLTSGVHPVDPFHSLDNLKSQFGGIQKFTMAGRKL